ncbi:MAG: peptidoglycan DD-metalloendopeptidase family protein [Candidatus Eremiobacterota bacterium]
MITKKIVAFFLFLFLSLYFSPAFSDDLSDKKGELKDIKSQISAEKEKIEEANAKEKVLSGKLRKHQSLLYAAMKEVDKASLHLKGTEKKLKSLKAELKLSEKVYAKHQRELDKRLQQIYEDMDPAYITVLTKSRSFSDFLNTYYYLQMIVQDDVSVLKQIRKEKEEINKKKVAVESRYNQVLKLKKQLNDKENKLAGLVADQEYLIVLLNDERKQHSNKVVQLEDEAQAMKQKIDTIINKSSYSYGSIPSYNGNGSLSTWPAAGPVTSNFGWRLHPIYGEWRFHAGVDIGADYDTPIYASGDGVIISSDWLGGYGNAVMIDHGGGVVTLYAHCSGLAVSCGQHVSKGQLVAYVGSTGNSTGPHLHFEVRQDGVAVDPCGFVN